MQLLLDNLPASLAAQRDVIERCLRAMDAAMPLRQVYLFGSHARGEAGGESDVDLCVVADGADRQLAAARRFREAMWCIWPRPAFTLIPISPARLAEKRWTGDHFFATLLNEGVPLATED